MTKPESVTDYIESQPPGARRALRRVRSSIRKALPDAEEVISYQIPAYKLQGRIVVYFAGWREHYSIYPATRELVAALGNALDGYEMSNKGTIRFPLSEPVPVALIARIAKFRAKEVAARHTAARAARPQRARRGALTASARTPARSRQVRRSR
jgi:uncharacterized protein YdhG (YjbR/CyaY superfamily)